MRMFPGLFYKKWEEAEYTQKLASGENTLESTSGYFLFVPQISAPPTLHPKGDLHRPQ